MRTIDELGISPAPWQSHEQFVISNDNGSVIAATTNVRDARIARLTEENGRLRECLKEALSSNIGCYSCVFACKNAIACPMKEKWRTALNEAK